MPDLRLPLHSADSTLIKIPTSQTLEALSTNSWERGLLGSLPERSPCVHADHPQPAGEWKAAPTWSLPAAESTR